MRYNLESTLPINAFSPRGGRSPFNHGMTLEGGGGGGALGGVTKALGSVAKGVTDVVKGVVQPVYNATLKQIPGVDKALVGLDKSVGKAIPGGWGTVASVAASFIPGAQLAALGMSQAGLATGLGALTGSGVMKKDHQFNLQGAIMGGAMAYGASQLSAGLQEAGKTGSELVEEAGKSAATGTTEGTTSALTGTGSAPTTGVGSSVTPTASSLQNAASDFSALPNAPTASQTFATPAGSDYGLKNLASNTAVPAGEFGINPTVPTAPTGLGTSAPAGVLDKIASGVSDAGKGTLENLSTAGTGIKNLVGLGDASVSSAYNALKAPITQTGLAGLVMGGAGLASLEAQQKELDSQLANGAIGQAEYATAKAKIDAEIATANQAVSANPLKTSADTESISEGPSLYDKLYAGADTTYDKNPAGGTTLYAEGGNVLMNPPDDQTGMPNQTPMQNFEHGGIMSMIGRTVPQQTFAAGGQARFLSGGGDGMSDSIKANIEGKQEARLADGEFVIPADVVSHIGNGSSKAGAKQLYSMMDRVRQARVGTKKQGKQINPRKYLAA